MRAVVLLMFALAASLQGDELTRQVTARLAEEADAFQRLAPKILGKETLHQKALKPPSRFHVRVVDPSKPPMPEWREREVVSEYAYASLGGESQTIHEMRQVTTAEGKH